MVELTELTPCAGLLPIAHGNATLSEVDLGHLSSLSPMKGQSAKLGEALKAAHDMAWPAAGRATGREGQRAIWFGRSHVLLAGPAPDTSLAEFGVIVDQSDAWAAVRLDGDDAVDVLARLVPVDLRPASFKRGHTLRTELQHMAASITKVGDRAFLILVFRSMAKTLVHDLKTAMEGVAARR